MSEAEQLGQELGRAITEQINEITQRQWAVSREVEIKLSPLEKWLHKKVHVKAGDQDWTGQLIDFGSGWVEIDPGRGPQIIYTGPGITIEATDGS